MDQNPRQPRAEPLSRRPPFARIGACSHSCPTPATAAHAEPRSTGARAESAMQPVGRKWSGVVALCDAFAMRLSVRVAPVVAGLSCVVLAGCAGGSSGSGDGPSAVVSRTFAAESGVAGAAETGDCDRSSFADDVHHLARFASQAGLGRQTTPVDALRASLTHGSDPYFGGTGGSGLVGEGFPSSGWTEISANPRSATFRAPFRSGTARLTFTRVGSRWMVSHGQMMSC
jgi:hypothetical protein